MIQKRLRIFAGPNGSGKTSMLKIVNKEVSLGFYINADAIEKQITEKRKIDLSAFGIETDEKKLHKFFQLSGFARDKSDAVILKKSFSVSENNIYVNNGGDLIAPEYAAAIIAEFLREENLKTGNDFSFETVMSHPDKIKFMRKANKQGYHCYLYFICTDDVRVNIDRIKTRVIEGGHHVPDNKVKTRYERTLNLLYEALRCCYKSYLFDNSDKTIEIARIDRDKAVYFSVEQGKLPNWFIKHVLSK